MKSIDAKEFYIRLNVLQKRAGITNKELAEMLELKTLQIIQNWKYQERIPSTEQLVKMCNIFNVSMDYLCFGIGPDTAAAPVDKDKVMMEAYLRIGNLIQAEIAKSTTRKIEEHELF